tara:strand:+ start:80 stop:535 length:456 start_codon:yes stop_codon:yes gene_type:complete
MRKIEAQTVQAVRDLIWMQDFVGTYFKAGNMEVEQSHHGITHTIGFERVISVRLHGYEIFALRPDCNNIWISDCGWQTATTKSRLNVLLGCFTSGFGIFQKNNQWFFQGKSWTDADEWTGSQTVQFRMDADNWMLQQAEKLATSTRKRQTV